MAALVKEKSANGQRLRIDFRSAGRVYARRGIQYRAHASRIRDQVTHVGRCRAVGQESDPAIVPQLIGLPAVWVAKLARSQREDVVPLRPALVKLLRDLRPNEAGDDARVFVRMPRGEFTAEMLRRDMKRAGIPEWDESGHKRVSYSLRHGFISALARAGVPVKQAMDLARHSDVNLTLKRDSHTLQGELSAALERPPDFDSPPAGTRGTARHGHGSRAPGGLPAGRAA